MIIKQRRIKVTTLKYHFGPRNGLRPIHHHKFVSMKKRRPMLLRVGKIKGLGIISGLEGFLSLLHYGARHPFSSLNVKKLLVEKISKKTAEDILEYFMSRTTGNRSLSEIIELRLKWTGRRRAVVHRFKKMPPHKAITFDLNNVQLPDLNTAHIRPKVDHSLLVSCMKDFIKAVERGSKIPSATSMVNHIWVTGMDVNEVEEVVNFLTALEAGLQTFPAITHIVDLFLR
ncbi:hypothetical protein DFH28DRAFT_914149 [Melampsora americana]|nr:hypothetical protein DFH28DRAFT_914149 [Melampsora americana]